MRSVIASFVTVVAFVAMAGVVKPDASRSFDPPGRLGIWEGHWKYSGQIFQTPYSDAHSDSGTSDCNWSPSNGYMMCEYNSDDPPHDDLSILSYSPAAKAYRHTGVMRDAKPSWEPVTLVGNTWTTSTELSYKGKTLLYQVVMAFITNDEQTTTVQMSADKGQTWVTLIQVTAVRIAS